MSDVPTMEVPGKYSRVHFNDLQHLSEWLSDGSYLDFVTTITESNQWDKNKGVDVLVFESD